MDAAAGGPTQWRSVHAACHPVAMSMRTQAWHASHTRHHSEYPPDRLAAGRTATVSVCLPARNEAATIGSILAELVPLRESGVIDQIVVVDHSTDGTPDIVRSFGVTVHDQDELMPELGPALGKGDAMWRALQGLTGDVVCFLDADSQNFGPHFACGMLGPRVCAPRDP